MVSKNKFIVLSMLVVALFLCGMGVALYLNANLGSDTITIFVDGISKTIGKSYGTAALLFNFAIVIAGYLIAPKNMGIAGVVYSFLMGYVVDICLYFLQGFNISSLNIMLRFAIVILAQVMVTLSYSILIIANLGMNPLDAVAYGLSEKWNIQYRFIRMTMDATMLVLGFVLGGVLGVGTVLSVLMTGPLVSYFSEKLKTTLG